LEAVVKTLNQIICYFACKVQTEKHSGVKAIQKSYGNLHTMRVSESRVWNWRRAGRFRKKNWTYLLVRVFSQPMHPKVGKLRMRVS